MSKNQQFRFTFSPDIVSEINAFALIHKHDDRKEFKENWENWTKNNIGIVSDELTRLKTMGYDGDIHDKMFKSARYYYRKKSTHKNEPKQRRKYIKLDKELIGSIDEYIKEQMYSNDEVKPSEGYKNFYNIYCERLITTEVDRLVNDEDITITREEAEEKIKKTYKNRHFIITNK